MQLLAQYSADRDTAMNAVVFCSCYAMHRAETGLRAGSAAHGKTELVEIMVRHIL